MRIIWLLSIFCLFAISCTKDLYNANETVVVDLFRNHGLTCEQLDDVTIKIHAFAENETANADYTTIEEGYYQFPYAAKATEMVFWFPLSVAFYPFLFVIPIAPDHIHPASVPLLLLNPLKSVAYRSKLVSTGQKIQKHWLRFREKSHIYPSPKSTIFVDTRSKTHKLVTDTKGNLILDIRAILNPKELDGSSFVIRHKEFQKVITIHNGQIASLNSHQKLRQARNTSRQKNLASGHIKLTSTKDYFVYGDRPQLEVFTGNLEGEAIQSSLRYSVSFVIKKTDQTTNFFSQPMTSLGNENIHLSPFAHEKEIDNGLLLTNTQGKAQFSFDLSKIVLQKNSISLAQQYNMSEKNENVYIKIDFTTTEQDPPSSTFLFPIYFPALLINAIPSREVFKDGEDNHLDIFVTELDGRPVQAKLVVAIHGHIMHLTTEGNIRIAVPRPQLTFSDGPGFYTEKFLKQRDKGHFPVTIWAVGKNGLRGKKSTLFSYDYHDLILKMNSSN
ncbi:hypothetical protein [Candidatus Uabimicrobium amorphum]|uniref:Uncharacterized protein n=1 Tax=Uabimicrobium amorphum TaxID=2596890 RepID=A0A5S9F674_UABAM|nr:hypothetical protein [Candidatus Uabimicrobium amorphum]BBM86883.1 hypothetical protein UABAM_05285 [Candidatus Uabimicrobium amorphum]